MTTTEFSNEFDVLYNNITNGKAPGLNGYEKSVFLTKAQDEIVKAYFSPNKAMEGFDGSERRQIDFSTITKVWEYAVEESSDYFSDYINFDSRSKLAKMPDDAIMIINEKVLTTNNTELVVIPLSYLEYNRLMAKPFKRPLKGQAWRLLNSGSNNIAELILGLNDQLQKYLVRYIKKPQAIIVEDLEGVTLDKKDTAQDCELDPILHHEILQRAVELAKAAYIGDLESQIALGQNSQTDLGRTLGQK